MQMNVQHFLFLVVSSAPTLTISLPILLRPLPHHSIDDVFDLRIARRPEQVHHLLQSFWGFFSRYHLLEHPHRGTALALPEFGVWIQSLQHVKRFAGIVELTHLVAVVRDHVQQVEGIVVGLHAHL